MSDYAFDRVLEDWLQEQLTESPILATALGTDGAHGEIDDLREEAFARRRSANHEWVERLESVGDDGLSAAQRVDRDAVLSTLRGRVILESWEAWRRDPMTYVDPCFDGILMLVVHRSFPESELAGYVQSRLRSVPTALQSGRAALEAELASPLIVGRARQQCEAAVSYFEETLPLEFSDGELRESVAEAGRIAAQASASFGAHLGELAQSARGSYALGEERYSDLLQKRELFDFSTAELRERGRRVLAELEEEANEIAARIDSSATSWIEVFNRDLAHHAADFEGLRIAYQNESEKARGISSSTAWSASPMTRSVSSNQPQRCCDQSLASRPTSPRRHSVPADAGISMSRGHRRTQRPRKTSAGWRRTVSNRSRRSRSTRRTPVTTGTSPG